MHLLLETISAHPGWSIWIAGITWLIGIGWVMTLMKAVARADRRAENLQRQLQERRTWERRRHEKTGPQVTALTLIDEGDDEDGTTRAC